MKLGLKLSLATNRASGSSLGLLDQYGDGVAAAYSLRYLTNSYTGDVVLVRRSSDNSELGFTPTEITDGTLTSWVGGGNDGFVITWYDQSSNNLNLSELSVTRQPRIVVSGVLVTDNSGNPSIDYGAGGVIRLVGTTPVTITHGVSVFAVTELNNKSISFPYLYGQGGSAGEFAIGVVASSNTVRIFNNGGASIISATDTNYDQHSLFTFILDNPGLIAKNGSIIGTGTPASATSVSKTLNTANLINNASFQWNGKITELIRYSINQSTNRTAIETAINSYYNIY